MRQDSLVDMLEDLQRQRPPVFMADEFKNWVETIGQTIHDLPTQAQRWQAIARVADEMTVPGMPFPFAYHVIIEAVLKATTKGRP